MPGKREFLSEFPADVSRHLLAFGEQLSAIDSGVIITMARKATCLIDAMATLGIFKPQVPVLSDRVLDMSLDWLQGRPVALVDDVLVSGSSLYRAADTISCAGGMVDPIVLAVDSEWHASGLISPKPPYLELDDRQSMALCGAIVAAIGLIPRPYNVDWPMGAVRLSRSHGDSILDVSGFRTTDTTSPAQRVSGVQTITAYPERWILRELSKSLGWNISPSLDLAKVRIYKHDLPAGSDTQVRVMPLVSYAPITNSQLDSIWESLRCSTGPNAAELLSDFTSRPSRLRAIQFITSARLGMIWTGRWAASVRPHLTWHPEPLQARYIFTPGADALVCQLGAASNPLFGTAHFASEVPAIPKEHSSQLPLDGPPSVQAALTTPFTQLYVQKERPARALLKARGKAALEDPELSELTERLRVGYSIEQLHDLASRAAPSWTVSEVRQYVSDWLDIAIDAGIVVPILIEQEGFLLRGFRHGEDVHFGEAEEYLCAEMLRHMLDAAEREALPRLITEKSLALLVKVGVSKGYLRRWDGRLGAPLTAGVRTALHGAVVRVGSTSPFGDDQGESLTRLLKYKQRIIEVPHTGHRSFYGMAPPFPSTHLPVTPEAEMQAQSLGMTLGKGLRSLSDRSVRSGAGYSAEQLFTLLATCGRPDDVPAALAAEVSIVVARLPSFYFAIDEGAPTYDTFRRLGGHDAVVACFSGVWKYENGLGPARERWLSELRNPTGEPLYDLNWRELVAVSTGAKVVQPGGEDLARRLASWLRETRLCLRFLQWLYGNLVTPQDSRLTNKLTKMRADLSSWTTDARYGASSDTSLAFWVERAQQPGWTWSPDEYRKADGVARSRLSTLLQRAVSIVDETKASCHVNGGLGLVTTFGSALLVKIVPSEGSEGELNMDVANIIDKYRCNSREDYRICLLPKPDSKLEWIVVASHRDGARALARLTARLVAAACGRWRILAALLPELSADERLYRGISATEYTGRGFELLMAQLADAVSYLRGPESQVLVLHPTDSQKCQNFLSLIQDSELSFMRHFTSSHFSSQTQVKPVRVGGWVLSLMKGIPMETTASFDVAVVTVIPVETRGARKLLTVGARRVQPKEKGRVFYEGWIQGEGRQWHSVVTQALDPNSRSIIVAARDIVDKYNPRLLILLGIAGSISPNARLGDVVIANDVLNYDQRKEAVGGTVRRGEFFKVPAGVRRALEEFFVDRGAPADWSVPGRPVFQILEGPIGTGSAVVADAASEIRNWLISTNSKTLAVDTEAAGIAGLAYESAEGLGQIDYLIIRGISDYADGTKNDDWHDTASGNAAEAVRALLPYFDRSGFFTEGSQS